MKILYLKGYKWLLCQNQRVRNDFLVIDGIDDMIIKKH